MHSGYFQHATHTANEVNELGGEAETLPISERRERRIAHEDNKWDEEHYMLECFPPTKKTASNVEMRHLGLISRNMTLLMN